MELKNALFLLCHQNTNEQIKKQTNLHLKFNKTSEQLIGENKFRIKNFEVQMFKERASNLFLQKVHSKNFLVMLI